jgi:hypothetical protein
MSWGNSTHKHVGIRSFSDAHKHFNDTKPVRSVRWSANERPLYKSYTPNYKLVRLNDTNGEAVAYDLQLYGTSLVRYLRPTEEDFTVLLRGYNTKMSWDMLSRHGWAWHRSYDTLDNRKVHVPLNPHVTGEHSDNGVTIPDAWSARLVFKQRLLDTSASLHRPVYTKLSTAEDKERRALVLKRLAPVLDAAMYRIPTMHAECGPYNWRKGRPFNASIDWADKQRIKFAVNEVFLAPDNFELSEFTVNTLLGIAGKYYSAALHRLHYNDEDQPKDTTTWPYMDAVNFRTGFANLIMNHSVLGTRSDKVPLPYFPDSLPRRFFW